MHNLMIRFVFELNQYFYANLQKEYVNTNKSGPGNRYNV